MPNTSFVGSGLYLKFGNTVLSGEFRSFNEAEDGATVDGSAGADTFRRKLMTLSDGSATYECVAQAGGTAIWAAVAPKTEGTLVWGPEGTATNKPKGSVNCVVSSRARSIPYDGIVTYSIKFDYLEAPTHGGWA
jgi:hypothetical protein